MQEMMTSENFTDVTLVTDDKKAIKAHRSVLSACSPVFTNIFQLESQNSHPVLYLRGIQYSEMESILQFMYLGEAKFYKERMDEFILVAKNLEVKELSKGIEHIASQSEDMIEEATQQKIEKNEIEGNLNRNNTNNTMMRLRFSIMIQISIKLSLVNRLHKHLNITVRSVTSYILGEMNSGNTKYLYITVSNMAVTSVTNNLQSRLI